MSSHPIRRIIHSHHNRPSWLLRWKIMVEVDEINVVVSKGWGIGWKPTRWLVQRKMNKMMHSYLEQIEFKERYGF
jgi:hypothetical protein